MSIRAIDWAFRQKVGSPVAKLILVKLADNSNDAGKCWPSLATISEVTELSRDAVIRHIKKLEEGGWLTIIHRTDGTASMSNVYQLHLLENMQGVVADKDGGGIPQLLGVVADKDTNRHIESSMNHKYDPSDHSAFMKKWMAAHPGYAFNAKDGAQLKRLLSITGKSSGELWEIYLEASRKRDTRRYWNCVNRMGTIASFAAAYNDIVKELGPMKSARPPDARPDSEAMIKWLEEQREKRELLDS